MSYISLKEKKTNKLDPNIVLDETLRNTRVTPGEKRKNK